VGRKIAEWTHNEAAYVSSGAAAGLVLSTAACIAGTDPDLRARLPFSDGLKNEIIVHRRGRVGYDFAIRQAGGVLVEIGDDQGASAAQFEAAINERTAAVFVFYKQMSMEGQVPLETQVEIAHHHGIPVLVDAAAQLPPVENLWRLTQHGRRPGHLQRRQGPVRPAELRPDPGPARPGGGLRLPRLPAPLHRPADEGRQRGDRRPDGGRALVPGPGPCS
jgi:hypothetical protein